MKKINSIHFGGKMILAGVLAMILLPLVIWLIAGVFNWYYLLPGGIILLVFGILFIFEMRQDDGKIPYYQRHLKDTVSFDPGQQIPVIRSSICTGEKVAGFKDKETRHFTEVVVIRDEKDLRRFMKTYGIDHVDTEY